MDAVKDIFNPDVRKVPKISFKNILKKLAVGTPLECLLVSRKLRSGDLPEARPKAAESETMKRATEKRLPLRSEKKT
jgi:hypothetical protein